MKRVSSHWTSYLIFTCRGLSIASQKFPQFLDITRLQEPFASLGSEVISGNNSTELLQQAMIFLADVCRCMPYTRTMAITWDKLAGHIDYRLWTLAKAIHGRDVGRNVLELLYGIICHRTKW